MPHFALSELLIVVVGLWAARRLYGAGRGAAALDLVIVARWRVVAPFVPVVFA